MGASARAALAARGARTAHRGVRIDARHTHPGRIGELKLFGGWWGVGGEVVTVVVASEGTRTCMFTSSLPIVQFVKGTFVVLASYVVLCDVMWRGVV